MEFITGIEERLAGRGVSVLLHVVADHDAEIEAYRRWAAGRLIDTVVLVNLTAGDRRPAVVRDLGLSAVVVGAWPDTPHLPAIRTDDAGPIRDALAHLVALGHRRIARVTGPADLLHTQARTAALREGARAAGVEPVIVEGDYSDTAGARLTTELLRRTPPPTAILYDNDVMAVAGLGAAQECGVPVPDRLSLLAWDDSTLCRLASPPLTTMSVDVYRFGVSVGESVLELVDGRPVAERWSPTARIVPRGSTAAPPGE